LDNPKWSGGNCNTYNESDMESCSGIAVSERPEHHIVSATLNVPGSVWPTLQSNTQAEQGLVTVSATETCRNKGNKK
jgi:hypothetical protein